MMEENITQPPDIINAGCYGHAFDIVACIRYSVMSLCIFITGVLCVIRIIQLHRANHQMKHHYFIFYAAALSCLLCLVHWLVQKYAQLDFMAQWFKQITYLLVTHFCWIRAHRVLGREKLTSYCLLPCLIAGFLYLSTVVVYGMIMVKSYDNACYALEWVLLSTAELSIGLMFLVAAFFINQRLNTISTISVSRREQKCKLWSLVVVFLCTAMVGVSYDVAMKKLSEQKIQNPTRGSCGIIYANNQVTYSAVFGAFMLIKFAAPVWVILHVLQPLPTTPDADDNDLDDETLSYQETDPFPVNTSESIQRRLHFHPNYQRVQSRPPLSAQSNMPNPTPVTEEGASLPQRP